MERKFTGTLPELLDWMLDYTTGLNLNAIDGISTLDALEKINKKSGNKMYLDCYREGKPFRLRLSFERTSDKTKGYTVCNFTFDL